MRDKHFQIYGGYYMFNDKIKWQKGEVEIDTFRPGVEKNLK